MSDTTLPRLLSADRIKNNLQNRMQDATGETPRRTTHGSHAWSLPSRYDDSLRQPQDGAAATPVEDRETAHVSSIDDARLSGGMRSLAHRVLGLNVTAVRQPQPAFAQEQSYFAESKLPKLFKGVARKGPDGTHLTDSALTNRPQVA
jgi:hypothetical protein